MTEKEKETRRAVAKIGYFQGHYQLGLIDYLVYDRSLINSDLLQRLDELDALQYKDEVTVEEVDSRLRYFIINCKGELCDLRDRLIELADAEI